ncbi:MAG: hypothetical protein COB78_00425 [Hyphomicrobiales bacterium]|nr:MAG: hypothetical protein COB78_00425 [Hyphomicrobiales bacterium]
MLKFIVMADLHIVAEGKLSHSLDTNDRFEQAIEFVNSNHGDADFVVIAGDLADHGERAAYERFKSTLEKLKIKSFLTLGNHDHRPTFLEVFGAEQADDTGNVNHVIDANGHRIIVLDSSDSEAGGAGHLEPSQLEWLQSKLDEAKDIPVIIILHHNITKFHVQTDFIILQDNLAFAEIVSSHPDIRQVISGHVHMTTSGTYKSIPFCTFAGCHYSIEPTLETSSGPIPALVARREGPGQIAVILADENSTVVHMENFIDRNLVMASELFGWVSDKSA